MTSFTKAIVDHTIINHRFIRLSEYKVSNKWKPWIRSILKFCLMLIIVTTVVLFFIVWGVNQYLESNDKKIIDNISFLNDGALSFKGAKISLVKEFPFASLILHHVELVDSMNLNDGMPFLKAQELRAGISLNNWKDKTVDIQTITIIRGDIFIHKDTNGFSNLTSLFRSTETNGDTSTSKININSSRIKLYLEDTRIRAKDDITTLNIDGVVNSSSTDLYIQENSIEADIDIDANVKELIFKEVNGSYISNSHLKATLDFSLKDNQINVPEFEMLINELPYEIGAEIPINSIKPILIDISSDQLYLEPTVELLTPKLKQTLQDYKIKDHFPAEASIILNPGDPAKVVVDFSLDGNDISVGAFNAQNVQTRGRFVNRKNDNGNTTSASPGNILLKLHDIQANHKSITVSSELMTITSNPRDKAKVNFEAYVTGPSSAISEWYESERFFFEGGQFTLQTKINSPIKDVKDILLQSSADLLLTDVAVLYKPANTSMPVHELSLSKTAGNAKFYIKSSTLKQQQPYRLDGVLENLSALLVDFANESATSNVIFNAHKLSWSDFISIFSLSNQNDKKRTKSEKDTKRTMKQTLRGIYKKFQPSVQINIDTFEYFNKVSLYDLKTGATFLDEHTLNLIETTFRLDQGTVTLNTSLDLSEDHDTNFKIELASETINIQELLPAFDYFNIELLKTQTTYPDDLNLTIALSGRINDLTGLVTNTARGTIQFSSESLDNLKGKLVFEPDTTNDGMISQLLIEGNPVLFNDFFKNDKFIFQDTGRFSTTFNFEGNVSTFDQMLQESVVDLNIKDGAVHNLDVDVIFPLNDLDLTLNQDTAEFNLYMYSDYIDRELLLTGQLDNLSELLFANTGKKLRTTVTASSPLINLSHAMDIFETSPDTVGIQAYNQIDNKMKQLAKDMLNRFNPHLDVLLDTFIINNKIKLHQLSTGVDMIDSSILILKETMFTFFDSQIKLNAEFDISNIDEAPFEANLETTSLDLQKTLHAFNYFGSSSMKNAEILSGELSVDLDLKSSIKGIELIEKKTKAIIDIELDKLQLKGIDVIDKIAAKLFARQLLKDIRFAPISNTITITGSHIDIPQMEIQSTGIDLFLEGYVDNKKKTNLWLSVPLDNIKRSPTNEIPAKRGYAATKRKVYLEVTSDHEGGMKSKFRLCKKKFYDQRGISDQFKEDKKRYKIIRRNKKKAVTNN